MNTVGVNLVLLTPNEYLYAQLVPHGFIISVTRAIKHLP